MTTHLGTTVEDLRVPKLSEQSPLFKEISERSAQLGLGATGDSDGIARVQALAARAYRLSAEEFRHVVNTFPLVPESERESALRQFSRGS